MLTKGQTLVEILLAIALAAVLLPALLTGLVASREGKAQQEQRVYATGWAQEAMEAVHSVEEAGWAGVSVNGMYHPVVINGHWSLVAGSEVTNGYTRTIVIADVYRDASGNIVASGGSLDPSTKKVNTIVSWSTPRVTSVSQVKYLTRYRDNLAHIETLKTDFDPGVKSNTYVTNTSGGEVILGAGGGGGDWCNPTLSVTTVDLSRQGVPTAIGAYEGNIVTGTGGNASGPTFVKTTVAGNGPPIATIAGQFNNSKANGVFTESTYGYIATTSHSQEIQILDLTQFSNPPTNTLYKQVGWFDAPGNGEGNSVYVVGSVGYMTSGDKFYVFDVSSHSGARTQLNSAAVTLAGTGNKIVVVGSYAFVAVNSTTTQLQIIDVTNSANPVIVASVAAGNNQPGIDVAVNNTGTRAYLVTSYASSSQPDFFIVNTTNKSGTLPLVGSGYNTNGMNPKGVAIATGNRALIVGTGGSIQYQVVSVSNELVPVTCGPGLSINGGGYAVASVLQSDGYAYSYVVTGDTNAELKIVLGGAGGQYVAAGTYESATLNSQMVTAFNRITAGVSQPGQTSIKMQVAVAGPVGGGCNGITYTYLGPNGDPSQYFVVGTDPTVILGAIPLLTTGSYANPGQCMRYKVYFSTTDSTASPELYDVTVNYSP